MLDPVPTVFGNLAQTWDTQLLGGSHGKQVMSIQSMSWEGPRCTQVCALSIQKLPARQEDGFGYGPVGMDR